TYADVFLNDQLLLKADNMFRKWSADCKPLLKPGNNVLRVRFRSPINEILPVMKSMKYQLPAGNDQGEKTSPHTRKAPYQFGWDWGPRFVTCGIWRPIFLEAWDEARINDLHIAQNQVTKDQANLSASVEVVSAGAFDGELVIEDVGHKTLVTKKLIKLTPGANRIALDFLIKNPSLWWPNGLGAHPLYTFKAQLTIGGKPAGDRSVRTGLRSL